MAVPSVEELEQMPLFQRIRKTREGLPLSQQKFAAALGVSERQVKRWESGTHAPNKENGTAIARLAERPAELFTPIEIELSTSDIAVLLAEFRQLRERVEENGVKLDELLGGQAQSQ